MGRSEGRHPRRHGGKGENATGLLGEDKCMETETMMARIGEDYLDMVIT
ncbi:MAG TPA: hypothetical protein VGK71_05185 [Nitrospirota bacterium]